MTSKSFFYKRFLFCSCILSVAFLYGETLRSKTQSYFDTMQWEEWDEEGEPADLEAHSINESAPIAYAQVISETAIYPSLPSLGLLDYHNVSNDILHFYDTIADGFLKKKLSSRLFNPQKPFLFHLVHFILDKLPQAVYVFYGKPVLVQDGTVCVDFKIFTTAWAVFKQNENQEHHIATEITPDIKIATTAGEKANWERRNTKQAQQLIPPLFSDKEPHSVIIEVAAIQKGKKWYIDHVDIKGAEYANSSLKN